jgi:hypothetical protein
MTDVLKRASLGGERHATMLMLLVVLTVLAGGCSSKRAVYIPSEWRTTAPPVAGAPGSERATPPQSAPSQPIMQPTPQIQERDLNAVPGKSPDTGGVPDASISGSDVSESSRAGTAETPQYLASMHLVNTAKTALQQGNTEQAIAQLEQAIQVDAYNAEAFFVLAQAWQAEGDVKRALEFARKAEILYQDEPQALKKVYLLEADLLKRSGQVSEAEIYRQKATRLGM